MYESETVAFYACMYLIVVSIILLGLGYRRMKKEGAFKNDGDTS